MNKKEMKPWGYYEVIINTTYDDLTDILVKRIVIEPNHCISYQVHSKRDEVWFIKQGMGLFVLNARTSHVEIGDILHIERGQFHQITNEGLIPLEILEIQHGINWEEDIYRISDPYDREVANNG